MSDRPPLADDHERRAWVRYPCQLETMYQPGRGRLDQRWWFATVRDISANGIGLILQRPFAPGEQIAVALYNPAQDLSRTVGATVVHAAPQEDGNWLIGCTFVEQLTEGEVLHCWTNTSAPPK
ncbi:MAG: PilZ domain-containing protein [Gemmataceae bacterium]